MEPCQYPRPGTERQVGPDNLIHLALSWAGAPQTKLDFSTATWPQQGNFTPQVLQGLTHIRTTDSTRRSGARLPLCTSFLSQSCPSMGKEAALGLFRLGKMPWEGRLTPLSPQGRGPNANWGLWPMGNSVPHRSQAGAGNPFCGQTYHIVQQPLKHRELSIVLKCQLFIAESNLSCTICLPKWPIGSAYP